MSERRLPSLPHVPSMSPFRGSDWVGAVARVVLGVLLLLAALPKMADPRGFKQTVRAFDFGPELVVKGVGYGLSTVELLLGVLLIIGLATRVAASISVVMTFIFVLALLQAAARGLKVDPGVFGVGGVTPHPSFALPILISLLLFAASVYLVLWPHTRLSFDGYLARNDFVPEPSAKRMRDPQGRRKYERDVAEKQRQAHVRELWINTSVVVVGIASLIVGIGVLHDHATFKDVQPVSGASAGNGYAYGKQAAATVDVYQDFFSPQSAKFAQESYKTLVDDAQKNLAQVRFHLIAPLDHSSNGSGYSTRAANAALCIAQVSSDEFIKYQDLLYGTDKTGKQVRPTSEGGVSTTDFTRYGTDLGLTTEATTFRDCVSAKTHKDLVEAMTEYASNKGVGITPAVYVNGKKVAPNLASVSAAIAKANVGATPKPSTSPSAPDTNLPSVSTTPSSSPSASAAASASTTPTPKKSGSAAKS
jgi:protein-disulfide isomerase/uncharacterized membrane protein YphA (DoxX/SURF4 family)